jgi:23S rRNA pseudouridine2604 synthase
MGFYRKIKYFLVHTLMFSNKKAQELIDSGFIEVNGKRIFENHVIDDHWEIKVNGKIVRPEKTFTYLKFYKPVGFQSSLNRDVKDNISRFFREKDLAIAGRLDKQSEGLLLLSNDGKWVEKICNPKFEKEKEYIVVLDKNPDADFINRFTKGVQIGKYKTLPCRCELIDKFTINVVLKEGKNRQIRKMCLTLGYNVLVLKRIRIGTIELDQLKRGEWETLNLTSK